MRTVAVIIIGHGGGIQCDITAPGAIVQKQDLDRAVRQQAQAQSALIDAAAQIREEIKRRAPNDRAKGIAEKSKEV